MIEEKAKKWLNDNQLSYDIWDKKYRHNNETFDEWLDRVSGGDAEIKRLIFEKKFLFGGRILANRGVEQDGVKATLSNCYVLSVDDSIESIYKCCSDIARTYSYGGGVGIDISKLRPSGATVKNAAKTTSGAVSFMKTFDVVTSTICQKGRRGALMISLDVNHPDIEEFVDIKANTDQITSANISVRVSDIFMKAVETDSDYWLQWPCKDVNFNIKLDSPYNQLQQTTSLDGQTVYYKRIKARNLFQKLAENNWNYAEPGILYWDKINHWNMMDKNEEFQYAGVNPCAEEPLTDGSACLLGAMNLVQYVENKVFNWEQFKQDIKLATVGLNNVLIEGTPLHPLQIQQESAAKWRAIGLGILDLAGALIKLGYVYGSKKAQIFANKVTHNLLIAAFEQSCDLNIENKPFDNLFDSEFYQTKIKPFIDTKYHDRYPLNSQLLTIAPTGTLSTMLQSAAGGGEPVFALSYKRTTKSLHNKDVIYDVNIPIVEAYVKEHNCTFEELPPEFITSDKIYWKDRIAMQAALQDNIDASISSTLNLSEDTTVENVVNLYLEAWKKGLKGATIFRRNCARTAILNDSKTIEQNTNTELQRGQIIKTGDNCLGLKRTIMTGCGSLHITAFFDPTTGDLLETYLNKGSQGGCQNFMIGLSRMMSLAARGGVKIDDILDQLKSCGTCPSYAVRKATKKDTSLGSCCPTAVGNALKDMHKEVLTRIHACEQSSVVTRNTEEKIEDKNKCPECGAEIIHESGCMSCPSCGFSRCG